MQLNWKLGPTHVLWSDPFVFEIRAMAFFATDCHSDIVEEINEWVHSGIIKGKLLLTAKHDM